MKKDSVKCGLAFESSLRHRGQVGPALFVGLLIFIFLDLGLVSENSLFFIPMLTFLFYYVLKAV